MLTSYLASSYAVAIENDKLDCTRIGYARVIEVKVEGDLVGAIKAALVDAKADSKTLVVCRGSIPKAEARQQARQFKGYVERFRFSEDDRGPAFLLLGKALYQTLAAEPDLMGRVIFRVDK